MNLRWTSCHCAPDSRLIRRRIVRRLNFIGAIEILLQNPVDGMPVLIRRRTSATAGPRSTRPLSGLTQGRLSTPLRFAQDDSSVVG
jgi:hypothetical protein